MDVSWNEPLRYLVVGVTTNKHNFACGKGNFNFEK
jgi:hypothetical protein